MKKSLLFFLLILLLSSTNIALAQTKKEIKPAGTAEEFEKQHDRNIRKSRINGVYIPKDIEDALKQLNKLSSEKSISKFKMIPEEDVAKKLHFGLGRWMIVNWSFYEGSRIEHYLRALGLGHPDDMADFLIITFHRNLNGKDLGTKELAESFRKKRLEEWKKRKVIRDTISVKKIKH